MKKYLAFLAMMLMVSSTRAFADANQDKPLEVVEFACARNIAERMPSAIVDCSDFRLPGPVYLWIRLRGNADALTLLKGGSPLIIHHKWVRYIGPKPDIDTIQAEEEIGAGAITPSVVEALEREVVSRGYFDWRTWTVKERLRKNSYSVQVLDEDYSDVPCPNAQGTAKCQIAVSIGR